MPHINELYDFTVSAFILHKGKILLIHHKKLNSWLQPGGHIELDEDPITALYREIYEETGLPKESLSLLSFGKSPDFEAKGITYLPIPFIMNVHAFNDVHQHIDMSYVFESSTDQVTQQVEESSGIEWYDEAGIRSLQQIGKIFENTAEIVLYLLNSDNLPKAPITVV